MSPRLGKRVFKRYSESFKQKVVHEIESGALTIHQAQKRYQIGSHGTITNWLKQLGKTDLLAQRVRIETPDEVDALKQLTADKQHLESALAQAHLRIATLESQLCQAKQLYGEDIKYPSIEALWHSQAHAYSLATVCAAHGVSRQAFYQYQQRQANERLKQEIVLQLVCQIRVRQPNIGTRKLYHLLKPQLEQLDCQLGRDALFCLLRDHGLLIESAKRGHRTTDANHRFHQYPNRITDLIVDRVHQVFVADITYLQTLEGFVYLALITDLFSRKVVGFDVSGSLSVDGALSACKMAIRPVTTIHHSDRGVQYCCHAYTQFLNSRGVQLSMTQNGDVYQNAVAERVNGILKIEFLLNRTFRSIQHAIRCVKQSVFIYNTERPHLSLGYQIPQDVYHKSQKQLVTNQP